MSDDDEKEKQSLIRIDIKDALGLDKPATALVEKISAGLGGACAPFLAEQRAKARKIDTASEISDLQERTEFRLICQETRKQENIESIAKQAIKELPPDASTENIQKTDEDWIAYLFKHCEIVSNKEMQLIWARILAGEATKTSTFSKRTLDIVSKLDKKDAELFTSFCQFVWNDITTIKENPIPLIYDINSIIYNGVGINFGTLIHLDTLGLITYSGAMNYTIDTLPPIQDKNDTNMIMSYYDETVSVSGKIKNGLPTIIVGKCFLTESGLELFRICKTQKNDYFFNYVIEKWQSAELNPVIQTPAQVKKTTE